MVAIDDPGTLIGIAILVLSFIGIAALIGKRAVGTKAGIGVVMISAGGALLLTGIIVTGLGAFAPELFPSTVVAAGLITADVSSVAADGTNACSGGQTFSLNLRAHDIENPVTALTEAYIWRPTGTTAWIAATQGTAITAGTGAGESIEVLMSTDAAVTTDRSHGPHLFMDNLPCIRSISIPVFVDEDESGLTMTFLNDFGIAQGVIYTAGEEKEVFIRLKSAADSVAGNPYIVSTPAEALALESAVPGLTFDSPGDPFPNLMYITQNNTEWDTPNQLGIKNGAEMSTRNCPQRIAAVVGSDLFCYNAPVVGDGSLDMALDANADDAVTPNINSTIAPSPTIGFIAAQYFVNPNSAAVDHGVENQDNTAVSWGGAATVSMNKTTTS